MRRRRYYCEIWCGDVGGHMDGDMNVDAGGDANGLTDYDADVLSVVLLDGDVVGDAYG